MVSFSTGPAGILSYRALYLAAMEPGFHVVETWERDCEMISRLAKRTRMNTTR